MWGGGQARANQGGGQPERGGGQICPRGHGDRGVAAEAQPQGCRGRGLAGDTQLVDMRRGLVRAWVATGRSL